MLQILHKGPQISIPQDQTGFTGNLQTDLALAVVTKMVAGKIVGICVTDTTQGAIGYAGLVDGLDAANSKCLPIGVLINDAAGYFFENPAAYASGMLAVLKGPAMIITDQWLAGQTFVAGTPVYAGASGLFTATPTSTPYGEGTAGQPIGIAMNAPAAGGNLQVALNGSF